MGLGNLGYICGGQLAAMGVEAAFKKGLHPVVLCTSETESAVQAVTQFGGKAIISIDGENLADKYLNTRKLDEFVASLEPGAPITFDWENAPADTLKYLESKGLVLKPSHHILFTTQHRGREKAAINTIHGTTVTAKYEEVSSFTETQKAFRKLGKGRLKTCEGGYDGKGQWVISSEQDIEEAFTEITKNGNPLPELIYEQNVVFAQEASIIVARNSRGEMVSYPYAFINHHRDGILRTTKIGLGLDTEITGAMTHFTQKIAEGLDLKGLMALELFLDADGKITANEIAARTHNSGHITRDTYDVSQFDLQILAMLDEKLPTPQLMENGGEMINYIGDDISNDPDIDWSSFGTHRFGGDSESIIITSYGKGEAKKGRKMGHKNIVSNA